MPGSLGVHAHQGVTLQAMMLSTRMLSREPAQDQFVTQVAVTPAPGRLYGSSRLWGALAVPAGGGNYPGRHGHVRHRWRWGYGWWLGTTAVSSPLWDVLIAGRLLTSEVAKAAHGAPVDLHVAGQAVAIRIRVPADLAATVSTAGLGVDWDMGSPLSPRAQDRDGKTRFRKRCPRRRRSGSRIAALPLALNNIRGLPGGPGRRSVWHYGTPWRDRRTARNRHPFGRVRVPR